MSEWISVNDKLPEEPEVKEDYIDCEGIGDCDGYLKYKEYLVTEVCEFGSFMEILFYAGNGKWWDDDGCEIEDGYVVAWRELPEPYVSPTKYRWRLNPEGYGHLREAYLVASSPFLMVSEWHNLIDNKNYKNVFTREEYIKLSGIWEFDSDLFVPEDIPDDIPDERKGKILWE